MMAALRDRSVEDLQHYMRAWSRWVRAWKAPLGIPSAVPMVSKMLPIVDSWSHMEDVEEVIDAHILRAVDAEVERLPAVQRAAVRLFYLNETVAAVFRSNRISRDDARKLCQQAELDLVPKLRARGVVLGDA